MYKTFQLLVIVLLVFNSISCQSNSIEEGDNPVSELCNMNAIDKSNLNGWDYGFTNDGKYIVYKTNTNKTSTVCVAYHFDSHYSFILDIDNASKKIIGFGTSKKYYPVKESDNEYLLYQWVDENIEFFSVPKQNDSQHMIRPNTQTRNPLVVGSLIVTSYVALKNLYMLSEDLHDGRWGDFFDDLGKVVGTEDVYHADGPFIALANDRINQIKAEQDYYNTYKMYGDAKIRITGINKQNDESYLVHTEIDGVSSIQRVLSVLTETSYTECVNHVYAGVLCRQSYSAFINNYTYRSDEMEISDGGLSTRYVTFKLPKLDKGKFYVRPYLRSSINSIIAKTGNPYMRYGEQEEINVIGGKIAKFEQADAQCIENTKVKFVAHLNVEIESNEGLEDWGVYYINGNDGVYKRFSASWPMVNVNEDIKVELTIPRDEFDCVDYEKFMATKTVKLGVFKKRKSFEGVFDNLTYEYGELNEYQLEYDKDIRLSIENVHVTGNVPYMDSEGRDRLCLYEYSFKVNGCLFFNDFVVCSGKNWDSDFKYEIVEGVKDDYMNTLSSSYSYFSKGTKVGSIEFGVILGNGVYHQLPLVLYCDNGSVYLGGTRTSPKSNENVEKRLPLPSFSEK